MQGLDPVATSLKFGTSGLRGLVVDLLGKPSRDWTAAFLKHLEAEGFGRKLLLVGRDLRASSPDIVISCVVAATGRGWQVANCGALPTPALALAAIERDAAAIMVTGSHIPDDRNGLKFYAPHEITKKDEVSIRGFFQDDGEGTIGRSDIEDISTEVLGAYRKRYLKAFANDALSGLKIGIYQQSSVARDLLVEILQALGAETTPLGRSAGFVSIDTEAHRPEDLAQLRLWAAENKFDALVSTDGDADRPLVADAEGEVVRGDILGLITATSLRIETIVTSVTCSEAVTTSGAAKHVLRTKVGSPYVIEGIEMAASSGKKGILGFEANGGVLLGTDVTLSNGILLRALPTRDALLPILCALEAIRVKRLPLHEIANRFGAGHAMADRLKNVPAECSESFLRSLMHDPDFASDFLSSVGTIVTMDSLDGTRFKLHDGSIVHFRASGNAPELRCYVEADTASRAEGLLGWALEAAQLAMDK